MLCPLVTRRATPILYDTEHLPVSIQTTYIKVSISECEVNTLVDCLSEGVKLPLSYYDLVTPYCSVCVMTG